MEQRGDRLGLLVVHRRNKTRWTQFLLLSGKLSLLKTDGEISTSNRLWLRFELVTPAWSILLSPSSCLSPPCDDEVPLILCRTLTLTLWP